MDVVASLNHGVLHLYSLPAAGSGGQIRKIGVIDRVGQAQSISMPCQPGKKHNDYIAIELDSKIIGVVPNIPLGQRIVKHKIQQYKKLDLSCILHILPLNHVGSYKKIKVT